MLQELLFFLLRRLCSRSQLRILLAGSLGELSKSDTWTYMHSIDLRSY